MILPLGTQDKLSHDEGPGRLFDGSELCSTCEAIELDDAFSCRPQRYSGRDIANIGIIDETWHARPCPLCRLIAAVRPNAKRESPSVDPTSNQHEAEYKLVAFSSTRVFLCNGATESLERFIVGRPWIDTVFLGVVPASERRDLAYSDSGGAKSVTSSGFISRLGSNCPYGTQAVTIRKLSTEHVDFHTIREWISCCTANHSRRCNPPVREPVPHLRLIECSTRKVVIPSDPNIPFAALSYVWGPPTVLHPQDQSQLGEVEPTVEDAIRVTAALGYEYLWVDRHCITKDNQDVRQEQLRSMDLLYAGAEVTIIAAAGQGASFGLPGVGRRARKQQAHGHVKNHQLVSIPPDPITEIESSTWTTRGWTYQEGVLSRRRLYFTEHEVSYECQGLLCREAVSLPPRLMQDMSTHQTRLMHKSWAFPRAGAARSSGDGRELYRRLQEYTSRRLTYQYDILNAMLGILNAYAGLKRYPLHHLCGVPILRAASDMREKRNGARPGVRKRPDFGAKRQSSLAGFADGLCWNLEKPGVRRDGFPSWSWTGWGGVVSPFYGVSPGISFDGFFDLRLSILAKGAPPLSWAEYDVLNKADKILKSSPDFCILEITSSVVMVAIRENEDLLVLGKEEMEGDADVEALISAKKHSPYTLHWRASVCMGDAVMDGKFYLTRDSSQDVDFQDRLPGELWLGVVLGNTGQRGGRFSTYVLVVDECKQRDCWERVGLLEVCESTLCAEQLESRTIRIG